MLWCCIVSSAVAYYLPGTYPREFLPGQRVQGMHSQRTLRKAACLDGFNADQQFPLCPQQFAQTVCTSSWLNHYCMRAIDHRPIELPSLRSGGTIIENVQLRVFVLPCSRRQLVGFFGD
jgi:hypothetical protein